MPLFKIHVEYEFAVEAASEDEAWASIPSYMREMDDEPLDYSVSEISSSSDYPNGYGDDTYPYGGDGKNTLAELLVKDGESNNT